MQSDCVVQSCWKMVRYLARCRGPVLSTLCALAKARGKGIWNPPSILEIREWSLEEGRSYCDMIEHAPTPPVITAKKK